MLSVINVECHIEALYAECHCAQCHCVECRGTYTRTVVIHNKSSVLLRIIFMNTPTLQLFTMNTKTEIIKNNIKMPSSKGLGSRNQRSGN
jgi:hypothetical protein